MAAKHLGALALTQYEARKAAVASAHPERAVTGILVDEEREDGRFVCGACGKALAFEAGVWTHPAVEKVVAL